MPACSRFSTRCRAPLEVTDLGVDQLRALNDSTATAGEALLIAERAAEGLTDAMKAISLAVVGLEDAGLLPSSEGVGAQECPVCLSPDGPTGARLAEVRAWSPLTTALEIARAQLEHKQRDFENGQRQSTLMAQRLKAKLPPDHELALILNDAEPRRARSIRAALVTASGLTAQSDGFQAAVAASPPDLDVAAIRAAQITKLLGRYRDEIQELEELAGAAARDDQGYALRERWLNLAALTSSLPPEVRWLDARKAAQKRLAAIRQGLIDMREEIIEDARSRFSIEMNKIWETLRSDTGARFSHLSIPPARGRGYKLELEVKASISDGSDARDVDALRVFSESQVNVIGIAAYVTRAKLLGHRLLILDDPVQSMDEEHFRSFAKDLLGQLVDEGYQVVLLTHSEEFARYISECHRKREEYATLTTRYSPRRGCQVDEGSRRVGERLKIARRLAEDGKLQEAWRFVRLAIERLYTLVKIDSDPTFDPTTWRNHSAENMWQEGVGEAIRAKAGNVCDRLREILSLTAAGAHDKKATSETDVMSAIEDLRRLPTRLRVGG